MITLFCGATRTYISSKKPANCGGSILDILYPIYEFIGGKVPLTP